MENALHLGPLWDNPRIFQVPEETLEMIRSRLTIAWLERNYVKHAVQADVQGAKDSYRLWNLLIIFRRH